jgi:lipopolysaccharide/colanic/teichoic acid biosynthesis glycosyltransferase
MKYWNKDKHVRQRHWTKVTRKPGIAGNQEIKRWCQLQSSTGRFYFYYGSNSWWFEHDADATLFVLRWS